MNRTLPRFVIAVAAILALGGLPAAAQAAPPSNDGFATATAIDPSTLPYNDSVVIDDATVEGGEPSGCYVAGKSIWYSITPTSSGTLRADISGSSFFDRIVYVYRQDGSGFGGLSTLACASPYYNGESSATFKVQAGKTYYLQAGGFFSYSTGTLTLSVQTIPPPPNDDFANATGVASVPFGDNSDLTAATVESGEPTPSCGFQPQGTVWYSFTPSTAGSYTFDTSSYSEFAAYTGSSLGGLSEKACRIGNPFTFHADAGTTYYIQVASAGGPGGPISVSLDRAADPVANFFFYPSDPSPFDTSQFYDNSYDPAGVGVQSESWSFGDGATATGCCPQHRYASDGDYTARLTIGTPDGRTASRSQVIQVRTHDVTIAKVLVPQSASVNQTRAISVGLTNNRYPETVQVQLLKSVAGGGFQQVGVLMQSVPVRGANRTTNFSFNYTFTSDDAALGKVTFEAIATIVGARDAIPTDNTVISLPTKVTR